MLPLVPTLGLYSRLVENISPFRLRGKTNRLLLFNYLAGSTCFQKFKVTTEFEATQPTFLYFLYLLILIVAHVFSFVFCAGGLLAVTDANLVLGRLLPDFFPHIFGKNENQPLDKEASKSAFELLTDEVQFPIKLITRN